MTGVFLLFLLQAAGPTGAASGDRSPANGLSVTLDIASAIGAVFWPLIVLIALLAYRRDIPALVRGLAGRVTKLELAGVSLELAKATAFVPAWSEAAGALDLRQRAAAIQVNDSTAMTFRAQLMEGGSADYAEVNLGTGQEWLTSRLFIMSILFARVKGIRGFVFVETSGNVRRRYVGWAEPENIRWALAKRYDWLEQAYAAAYSEIVTNRQAFIVNHEGKLGYKFSAQDAGPSLELIKKFLLRVQAAPLPPVAVPSDAANWILIDAATNTHEHASWMTSEEIEEMLGSDLNRSTIRSSELRQKSARDQLRTFLSTPELFSAVVEDDRRFEYLLDRRSLLEQVARSVSAGESGSERQEK